MSTDDGSYYPGDDFEDSWRDQLSDVLSMISRRVSLAILSAGFAVAGSNLIDADASSLIGRVCMGGAVLLGAWAIVSNRG